MPKRTKWTIKQLKKAIKESTSYRQTLRKLGLKDAGGNYATIQKYIENEDIDTSHFKGRGWNAGMTGIGKPRKKLEDILVKGSKFQSYKLKRRLFKNKLKPKECEECGWSEKAKTGHLPLELHHKNGDRHDNRLKNLQILCPNCHSLKPGYRGRSLKKD